MKKTITLSSNDNMPMMGLGTWQISNTDIPGVIQSALKTGYRHIDCASIYKNEAAIGEALSTSLASLALSRDDLWLTSKLWNSFHLPEDVEPALKQTLSDLKTDYLDLYLIHWPVCFNSAIGVNGPSAAHEVSQPQIPAHETWQALEDCVKKGLVKNIGLSNFSISKITALLKHAVIQPAVNQIECHAYFSQNELVKFCQQHNIQVTAYSPLAAPALPDMLKNGRELPILLKNTVIAEIASKHQATPAQILLAWLMSRNMIVIPKSTDSSRIKENWNAQIVVLDKEDSAAINDLNINYRYTHPTLWEFPENSFKAADIWK